MRYAAVLCFWPNPVKTDGLAPTSTAEVAVDIYASGGAEAAASVLAAATDRTFDPTPSPTAVGEGESELERRGFVFPDLPDGVGIQVLRARDGWVALAAPDRARWLTISMTFLRRRLYHRYDEFAAWQSAEVNELATLVLATHHAEDVVGTCDTYGIPAFLVPGWQDTSAAGGGLPAALAGELQYATIIQR